MRIPNVTKILDLSQPIFHNCPGWPTYRPTNVNYEAQHVTHGYLAERLDCNSHTGTHLDAPRHFFPEGKTVEEMDLFGFQGRGVVLDLRKMNSPSIGAQQLMPFDGLVKDGDVVLLYTGWGEKRAMTAEYMYEWPYIAADGAQWLVDRGVKMVCIDGMSAGGWPEGTGRPPHEVLLSNEVIIVEEVYMNEELLEEEEWYVTAFPIKLQGFGGAPCRVVAMKIED
ncbi:MAG: cyclase family protein [Christensenella sp.]|nr:cyclase family protein [Christensenella sp.]